MANKRTGDVALPESGLVETNLGEPVSTRILDPECGSE